MADLDEKGLALLPCPHCGEAEHLYPAYRIDKDGKCIVPAYAIDCLGCGSDFTPRKGIDAKAAWNRRFPSSQPVGLVEAARNAAMYLKTGFIECPKCGAEVETKNTDAEYALNEALASLAPAQGVREGGAK